jgi:hypothetical protein
MLPLLEAVLVHARNRPIAMKAGAVLPLFASRASWQPVCPSGMHVHAQLPLPLAWAYPSFDQGGFRRVPRPHSGQRGPVAGYSGNGHAGARSCPSRPLPAGSHCLLALLQHYCREWRACTPRTARSRDSIDLARSTPTRLLLAGASTRSLHTSAL